MKPRLVAQHLKQTTAAEAANKSNNKRNEEKNMVFRRFNAALTYFE